MKSCTRFALFLLLNAALVGAPAVAHHSITIYDYSKVLTIQGTVKSMDWTNPHSYLHVLTLDASGAEQTWRLEFGTPGLNARMGWRKESLKPGDKLTLTFSPIRDGTYEGALRTAVFPDGHTLYAPAYYFKIDSSGRPILASPSDGSAPNPAENH